MPDLQIRTTGEIAVRLEYRGGPVLDRAVFVSFYNPRGTQLFEASSAAHVGDGWYQITVAANLLNLSGTYRAVWASPGDPSIEVQTYHSCGYISPDAVTLGELKERVIRESGMKVHEGQAVNVDDPTLVCDPSIVMGDDGEYAGGWLIFMSGDNIGMERRVVGYDAGTNTLQVQPAFPNAIGTGDRYLLSLINGQDVVRSINSALSAIGANARLEVEDDSLVTVAGRTDYQVPGVFDAVHKVLLEDSDLGVMAGVPPTDWTLLPGSVIRLHTAPTVDGVPMRIVGTSGPQLMYLDSQFCEVRAEFVIAYAVHLVHAQYGGGQMTDPDEHRRSQLFYAQAREVEYRRAIRRIPTNSRSVRLV